MIIDPSHTLPASRREQGGKGYHLQRLQAEGYAVPPFFIIPASFFDESWSREMVMEKVRGLLPDILHALPGTKRFAVRSSAIAEDSAAHSFAGQFTTLLEVVSDRIPEAVAEVIASANNDAVVAYRQHAGLEASGMAVIVQRQIDATAAGVAFGLHPVSGKKQPFINAVKGLGDVLVNGTATADSYSINADGTIESQPSGKSAVLTETQVKEVAACLSTLETVFQSPQDIEFCFEGDKFWLLQARPVTAVTTARKIIWDNSNIVESYPGLTLPLTFSFIEKMYEAVYRQFSMVLGVPEKKIDAQREIYANMLGLLNGRVYYNLNSWYAALAQLPGYRINAAFMEKMMGVREKFELETVNRRAGISDYLQVVYAVGCILKNLLTVKKQKRQFIADFHAVYDGFNGKDYSSSGVKEVWLDYRRFEALMLAKWKAPLVNDFFAMIYFGILHKLCAQYDPQDKDLHNKLLAASHDVITTEPLRRLPALAGLISSSASLKNIFLTANADAVWMALQRPEYLECLNAVNQYLADWGERCVGELKLETITYQREPQQLIAILQSYVAKGLTRYEASDFALQERTKAEKAVLSSIRHPIKRALFRHVLKKARYLVSNRENLRYYRTRGFGAVRNMMLAIGRKWREAGHLDATDDIFYCTLSEIEGVANGRHEAADLRKIVADRKKEYALFPSLPLPARIVTSGAPGKVILAPPSPAARPETGKVLQGIGCSAGVVKARVRLVQSAAALETLDGQIMATYATDPGWVVLFPSASGILTERGSLLSHAAIVSREMGIPCIVGVEGLMKRLNDGDEVIMDGSTGLIQIINASTDGS